MTRSNLHFEIATTWDRFWSLREPWNALLFQSRADTLFLTWEWMASWVEGVQERVRPLLILAWEGSELIGIAPLFPVTYRLLGVIPYRVLRFWGDYATGSEYLDFIVRRDREVEGHQTLLDGLNAIRKEWDCIWIPRMSGWSGALERFLVVLKEAGWLFRFRTRDFAWVPLPEDPEKYFQSLSPNRRSQLRRQMKKIGQERIEIVRCERKEDLPKFLEALFYLNQLRWASVGLRGTFQKKPEEADFYRRFTSRALERGWLWLYGLKSTDNTFQAVQIGYVYGNTFLQLQEGFNPNFVPGVGNVLRLHIVEQCIKAGIQVYDFLGEMSEHKKRWGARRRVGFDLLFSPPEIKNRLLFTSGVWPEGRYLKVA